MSWTDERVELLKRLWTEGLSASQIAAELGGVTRNAVIGKIHRLGMSGRAKGTASTAGRRKSAAPRNNAARSVKSDAARSAPPAEPVRPTPIPDDIEQPKALMLDLLQLTEGTCKFPIGDPQETGFGFCGAKPRDGDPYCEYHCRIAYQPAAQRSGKRSPNTPRPPQKPSTSTYSAF